MFCEYCGNELEDDALFCDSCGKPIVSETVAKAESHRCPHCGSELDDDALFCEICGMPVPSAQIEEPQKTLFVQTTTATESEQAQNAVPNEESSSPIEIITSASTETKDEPQPEYYYSEPFSTKNLFAQVFKSHTAEERAEILRAGVVEKNEPSRISSNDLQPWLYSRVLFILLLVFGIFEICLLSFKNANVIPGIMFVGSLLMPFSILTMYFELNAHKDISFYSVIGIFFLGGAMSLLFTLFLYEVVPSPNGYDFLSASLISVVEEIGKVIVIIPLIKRHRGAGVLQGLLIGGAVGCGFAVPESAGYAFRAGSVDAMNSVIFLRAIFAFGGHTAWAAIEGAAFAKEKKMDGGFFMMFATCFFLHALWDTDMPAKWLELIVLCFVAWHVIIRQISGFISENNAQKSDGRITHV